MPCAAPPAIWPSTSAGLTMRPQSSTATYLSRLTRPGIHVHLDDGQVSAVREGPRLGFV